MLVIHGRASDYNPLVRSYDKETYSRLFAQLLERAMQKRSQRAGLRWLERKYRLPLALLFTRHKLELADAYMDVREHILKRIEQGEQIEEQEKA